MIEANEVTLRRKWTCEIENKVTGETQDFTFFLDPRVSSKPYIYYRIFLQLEADGYDKNWDFDAKSLERGEIQRFEN